MATPTNVLYRGSTLGQALHRTLDGIVAQVRGGAKARPDGLFVPSCFEHTGNLCMRASATRVANFTFAQSLYDWFLVENGSVPHQLVDDCGDGPCNAHCRCGA